MPALDQKLYCDSGQTGKGPGGRKDLGTQGGIGGAHVRTRPRLGSKQWKGSYEEVGCCVGRGFTVRFFGGRTRAAGKIPVLILDGESAAAYHNWQAITPVLKKELDEVGLFDVDVLTAAERARGLAACQGEWSKYKVVVFNYDAPDERWPDSVKQSFEEYMRNGGGLVTIHAADNAFPNWKAFNAMIGVGGWRGRNENAGPHWYWKDGKLTSGQTRPAAPASTARGFPFW